MQSETWIKKAGFRSEAKIGVLMQLKKRLFNPRCFDHDFQLDQAIEKIEISDPTRQSDSCIGKIGKPRRILVRVSHTHTRRHKRQTNPHHTIGDAGFGCCHFCRFSTRVSVIHPLSTPVSSTRQHRMAAVRGIDDLLPTAPLAVALATFDEIQRHDGR